MKSGPNDYFNLNSIHVLHIINDSPLRSSPLTSNVPHMALPWSSHGLPTVLSWSFHGPFITVLTQSSHGCPTLTMWPWCWVCAVWWYGWVGRCIMHSLQHIHVPRQCQHVQNMVRMPTCENVYVHPWCRYIKYMPDLRQRHTRCTLDVQCMTNIYWRVLVDVSRPYDIHVQFARGTLCICLSYTLYCDFNPHPAGYFWRYTPRIGTYNFYLSKQLGTRSSIRYMWLRLRQRNKVD
jgi:hypothetical protein